MSTQVAQPETTSTPSAPAPAAAASSSASLLDAPQATTQGAAEERSLLDSAGSEEPAAATQPDAPKNPAEPGKPEQAEQKPAGAPEKYADFRLPEGSEAAKDVLDGAFVPLAKELNLSQDAAQKLIDFYHTKVAAKSEELRDAAWKAQVSGWKQEAIQALGPNYQKELSYAAKARDRFATPEFKQLLNDTGLANHKEVIGYFLKVGKAISEDGFVDGSNKQQPKSDAEIFYPTMK